MEDSRQTLSDAQWLQLPHVHIKDSKKVVEKINAIFKGGKDKLQVIFDFDRTLTKHHHNGVITDSSYGVLEKIPSISEEYREASRQTLEKYLPIELDPNLSIEEKLPHMMAWWTEGLECLKKIEWDPVVIEHYLQQNPVPYRDGTEECFKLLKDASVPVLVFSAGVGDVVKSLLQYRGLLTSNVHIISNFLNFKDGKITGYVGDIIHVFNKNEQLMEGTPYYDELKGRSNVILLGDSTGDAAMADGVPHDTVVKIGFLNTKIEESLSQYKDLFDIVLTDDQTMDVLKNILKQTLS